MDQVLYTPCGIAVAFQSPYSHYKKDIVRKVFGSTIYFGILCFAQLLAIGTNFHKQ